MRRFSLNLRRLACLCVLLLLATETKAASTRTANFAVDAPSADVARQCAECAEQARKAVAKAWLGGELPDWREPCLVKVTVTQGNGGGATHFRFENGKVASQWMHVEGSTNKLPTVLWHEVTHTVLNGYFGRPVPRFADEGSAVCSETDEEQSRHDRQCREILNTPGRRIPLARLFALEDYPSDVAALYAEGWSVSHYLIELKGRANFLGFIWHGGMAGRSWDEAARATYGFDGVADLESHWLAYLKQTKGQALNATGAGGAQGPSPSVPRVQVSSPGSGTDRTEGAAGPGNSSSGNTERALSLLIEAQRLLAADVKDLKASDQRQNQRLDRIESALGWSQPRAAQQPANTSLPTTGPTQPYRPGMYAQPTAAPPSASPFVQPFCAPGGY